MAAEGRNGGLATFLVGLLTALVTFLATLYATDLSGWPAALLAALAAVAIVCVEQLAKGRSRVLVGALLALCIAGGFTIYYVGTGGGRQPEQLQARQEISVGTLSLTVSGGDLLTTPNVGDSLPSPSDPASPVLASPGVGGAPEDSEGAPVIEANVTAPQQPSAQVFGGAPDQPGPSAPAQTDPGYIEWLPDVTVPSATGATVDVSEPVFSSDGSQRIVMTLSNLSQGAIEYDILNPWGGTVFGASFRNGVSTQQLTFIMRPWDTGTYSATVHDKVTDASSSTSFYLTAVPNAAGIQVADPDPAASDREIDSVSVYGRACDSNGARVEVKYHGMGVGSAIHIEWPTGQYLDGGLYYDSLGSGAMADNFRSERCTGADIAGFSVDIRDQADTVVDSMTFSVAN